MLGVKPKKRVTEAKPNVVEKEITAKRFTSYFFPDSRF